MAHMNLTPRWGEILPTWIIILCDAAKVSKIDQVERFATEAKRMAQAADHFNDLVTHLRNTQGWKDDRFKQAMVAGRELNETARNTVHEDEDA